VKIKDLVKFGVKGLSGHLKDRKILILNLNSSHSFQPKAHLLGRKTNLNMPFGYQLDNPLKSTMILN